MTPTCACSLMLGQRVKPTCLRTRRSGTSPPRTTVSSWKSNTPPAAAAETPSARLDCEPMGRVTARRWLVPVPLAFGFDPLTGAGWPVIAGTVLATAAVLPIRVRIHAGRTPARALWIAVLGLLVSLGFVAIAETLSLTVLWLSLITLALL